jgi:DNA-binding transcriptional regulator YiaG
MSKTDAKYLIKLLENSNMTNLEFARFIGVSERTVYRWLNGTSRIPASVFKVLEMTQPK